MEGKLYQKNLRESFKINVNGNTATISKLAGLINTRYPGAGN